MEKVTTRLSTRLCCAAPSIDTYTVGDYVFRKLRSKILMPDPVPVADLEILKGGFSRLVGIYTAHGLRRCAETRSGDKSL